MQTSQNICDLWDAAMDLSAADGTDALVLLLDTAAIILANNGGSLNDATTRIQQSFATSAAAKEHLNTVSQRRLS